MSTFAVVIVILLMLAVGAFGAVVEIDTFADTSAWSVNEDDGGIAIACGKIPGPGGVGSMYLDYSLDRFPWGNAKRSSSLPPNATGIEFQINVDRAAESSAMHVWLMEEDGDGYVARVVTEASLNRLGEGWHDVFVPLSSFTYEPRGNGRKEFLTVNTIMLGLNYASTSVHVANLRYRLADSRQVNSEPKSSYLAIDAKAKISVGVLKMLLDSAAGHSDPHVLCGALDRAGFSAIELLPGDLADASVLNTENFDCIIFPSGPNYPFLATENIKNYLKAGGNFVSMGGYAFDSPMLLDSSGKYIQADSGLTAAELAEKGTSSKRMNTRIGTYGDTMALDPDQIGVFDPCYPLLHVSEYNSVQEQFAIKSLHGVADLQGYAACSLLGSDSPVFPDQWGRHVPLVRGYDEYGRYRGDIGSIAHNFAGPYAGSSWAFFGVTNKDLFREGPLLESLPEIVQAVCSKVYLHSLKTNLACYRDKETVEISATVADYGKLPFTGSVLFIVLDNSGKPVYKSKPLPVSLQPGKSTVLTCSYSPGKFASDFYRVTASLISSGKQKDTVETGFVAYSSKIRSNGLRIELINNYFHGNGRSLLLSGTNQTGAIFYSGNENPLVWDRDLSRMRDFGVNVMRVLHFSPFVGEDPRQSLKPLQLNVKRLPLKTERQLDALVQLCQKNQVALFLSIHDWMNQDLTDEELQAQHKFAELICARYSNVPGLIIDIQNEPMITPRTEAASPEIPDILREWNNYLKTKYGTDKALEQAWKISPPEAAIGKVPYRAGTDQWEDLRTLDAETFRQILLNRWIEYNVRGCKSADPDRLVTTGFLQEYWSANKLINMQNLDFANMHSYTSLEVLSTDIKLFDRRFENKSLSLGEFGSVTDHDRRARGQFSTELDWDRYLQTGHYVFGLGGSLITNWCWKEMDDAVFPWGINYANCGPAKTLGLAYRNQSLLMRQIRPEYRPSKLFLVAPVEQMLGGKRSEIVQLLYKTLSSMFYLYPDIGIIDDRNLDKLPKEAEALIYPVPYELSDKNYHRLKSFVERGGRLYVSGDISFDSSRHRTQTDRLLELCGVRFVSEKESASIPQASVEPVTAVFKDGLYINKLGKSEVYFTTDLYNLQLLEKEHTRQEQTVRQDRSQIFFVSEEAGHGAFFAVNPTSRISRPSISFAGTTVELELAPGKTGLARFDSAGSVLSVESQGRVLIDNREFLGFKGHYAVCSLDARDLRSSRQLLVLPFGEGQLSLGAELSGLTVARGEIAAGVWTALGKPLGKEIVTQGATRFDAIIIAQKADIAGLAKKIASELLLTGKH